MAISASEVRSPVAIAVSIGVDTLSVELDDGRTIVVPLAWYPRLLYATPSERATYRLIGKGSGIHWPDIEEDIRVEALLSGGASAESAASLKRWLASRSSTTRSSI